MRFILEVGHRFAYQLRSLWPTSRYECRMFIAAIATENTPDQSTLCPIELFPPR